MLILDQAVFWEGVHKFVDNYPLIHKVIHKCVLDVTAVKVQG
jgi:hypothetical protein